MISGAGYPNFYAENSALLVMIFSVDTMKNFPVEDSRMVAKKSKLYSTTDIESIRGQLAELPDVTQERLQKRDVLDSLKSDIETLIKNKGYTLSEILEHLKNFGFHDVTLKDLKEITEGKRTRQRKRVSSSTDDKTPVRA
ncbi:MobC [Klebsiella quasipneumoniae]|uniref:MobC n=1 Tax=Enterobacter cloacae TaxID=550 RepID=UPI003905725D